jgi:uncharacterized membrane protein YvbJ
MGRRYGCRSRRLGRSLEIKKKNEMDKKTILYIALIIIAITFMVLLQRLRNCENKKQRVQDYFDAIKNGTTPTYTPSAEEILQWGKKEECKFWSF